MTTRTVARLPVLIVLCGFLMAGLTGPLSGVLQAHHSVAGVYDLHKDVVLVGTLKKLHFTNPHSSIELTVKNKDGSETDWNLVTASNAVLTRQGVTKDSIKPGEVLKVTVLPARNGNPLGIHQDARAGRQRRPTLLSG